MSFKFVSIVVSFCVLSNSLAQGQSVPIRSPDSELNFYEDIAREFGEEKISISATSFDEVPDGLSTSDIGIECEPRRLEDTLLGKNVSMTQYYAIVKKYFKQCSRELTRDSTLGILGLVKFARFKYSFLSHPQVKKIKIKIPGGSTIPGILALKQDSRPRPLVIVKCGVFCAAEETASLKSYLMHLFDQSPFNVLVLANKTGIDYISLNKKFTVGGWSEGYELIQVGKWMQEQWEYRNRISSIHLMGISLGGNAAVMGAVYNERFTQESGKKVFNSVTAICPVVSLKSTLDHLYSREVIGRAFAKLTRDQLREARKYLTDVPDMLSDSNIPGREGLAEFIGDLATASLRKNGINIETKTFFKNNNFWNWHSDIKSSFLIWASKDDMIVNNKINAHVLEHDDFYENSSTVGTVNLEHGNHCGFSSAYGSFVAAAVLRTFVLKNSPEFIEEYRVKNSSLWPLGFDHFPSHYTHVGQYWKFINNSEKVKVTFKLVSKLDPTKCGKYGSRQTDAFCTKNREFWVPISSLKEMGGRVPRNEAEAQALTREFNTKVEFRTGNLPLTGTNRDEFFMTWRAHFE